VRLLWGTFHQPHDIKYKLCERCERSLCGIIAFTKQMYVLVPRFWGRSSLLFYNIVRAFARACVHLRVRVLACAYACLCVCVCMHMTTNQFNKICGFSYAITLFISFRISPSTSSSSSSLPSSLKPFSSLTSTILAAMALL